MKKAFIAMMTLLVSVSIFSQQQSSKDNNSMKKTTENKNVVVETILSRRSIRSYQPEQISDAELDTIIQCGINAPSALNNQSWEIRIIQNPKLLKKINAGFINYAKNKNLPGSASKVKEAGFSVFHGAPTLMIVAYDTTNSYSPVDCGLFAQNVLLTAHSMDIGTCVVGSIAAYFDTPEAQKEILPELKLSADHKVLFSIAIGYKNENPYGKPRDKSKVQVIK